MTEQRSVEICIGGVLASATAIEIATTLGSCVAVCLYDNTNRVGGMNHFSLPGDGPSGDTRYGGTAIRMLVARIVELGGQRQRLLAKVFGGGHVIDVHSGVSTVARQNVEYVGACLDREKLPVVAQDVGGHHARRVRFHTDGGAAWVRPIIERVPPADGGGNGRPYGR